MKITQKKLRQLIKEEIRAVLKEADPPISNPAGIHPAIEVGPDGKIRPARPLTGDAKVYADTQRDIKAARVRGAQRLEKKRAAARNDKMWRGNMEAAEAARGRPGGQRVQFTAAEVEELRQARPGSKAAVPKGGGKPVGMLTRFGKWIPWVGWGASVYAASDALELADAEADRSAPRQSQSENANLRFRLKAVALTQLGIDMVSPQVAIAKLMAAQGMDPTSVVHKPEYKEARSDVMTGGMFESKEKLSMKLTQKKEKLSK
jgi:hypothetical protein